LITDPNLANRLQVWGFEEGLTVFGDGSLGAGLRLTPLDVSCKDDEDINALKRKISTFLGGLHSGSRFQIFQEITSGNEAVISGHEMTLLDGALPVTCEVTGERVRKLRDDDKAGLLPVRRLYLFLRLPFSKPLQKPRLFGRRSNDALTEKRLLGEIEIFKRKFTDVRDSLAAIGVEARPLSEDEIFKIMFDYWNPGYPLTAQGLISHDIRDQTCLTDVVIGPDHFMLGSVFHKVVSLKLLPEQTFSSMAESLRDLPFDSKLLLTTEVLDQAKEISSLQMQRRVAFSQVMGAKGVADLDAQAKLDDIEALLSQMIQGSERVFRMSLTVVLRSKDESELEANVMTTLQKLRELSGAEAMVETVAAFDIFCEIAPPNAVAKDRMIRVNTSVLADFLPLYGLWEGHEVPRVLMRTRDGGIFKFDPFSDELGNSNQIISGSSGAGKSFVTNLIISQMAKERPRVFILDIGGSYQKTTTNLEGQYIPLGLNSGQSINPFASDGLDEENRDQKIKFILALVEIMTKESETKALGRIEKSEIEILIRDVLENEDEPLLRHLRDRLLGHAEIELKRIGRILSLWCEDSPYGKFVDRPTSVNLTRDIVCWDLKGLETHPELQAVCLFLIADIVWREVQKDRTKMKILVFDECWKLLESDESAAFIGEMFRTLRKYRASAVALSQTMDDFSKSKVASAILPNASIKWLLRQKGSNSENLKSALSLNIREINLIGSLRSEHGKYSEAYLMAEDRRQVVRIEATPLEYWQSTTAPRDIARLNDLKAKNPHLTDIEIYRLAD
jgi:conjugal transfer ATP-binding protein TraC